MLEHELLINCAKTKLDPQELSRVPLDALDWNYILQQAQVHNIGSLLYNNLKDLSVPVHSMLEAIYTHTAFHNMLYLEELKKVEDELGKEGIEVIVLKGPAMAQDVYDNVALRPFVDIDLLVRKKQLPEIKRALNVLGYMFQDENFYEKYHFHLPCTRKEKIVFYLELHWAFVDRFILNRVDMDKVRQAGSRKTLPLEINILYLLLHIEKHAFLNKIVYREENCRDWIFTNCRGNKLIWYTDLYELISNNEVDWENLLELSKEWCMQHIAYYNLYILNQLYPLPQVEDILSGMPGYKINSFKRFFYSPALRKKDAFELSADMQLRPIRALDLVDYLFPSVNVLVNYYCIKRKPRIIIYYILHISAGLKEIFQEFIGICQKKLYTNRRTGYPAAG